MVDFNKKSDDEKKTYFNVIAMSENFREFDLKCKSVLSNGLDAGASDAAKAKFFEVSLMLWEIRCQLATAQQLTVISDSLKRILKLVPSADLPKAV